MLLLGPSGAGKSTLALCLDGIIPRGIDAHWESGSVTVAGKDTRTADLAELTSTVGVLFQDPEAQLVMLETDDEIAFGLENLGVDRQAMRERVREARAATGLGAATPRQLERLSGGTKQRVVLASLLAMRPRGVVLDEPTANLDPAGAREIIAAYARLCADRERSLLLIEHRLDLVVGLVDQVAVLGDDGGVALEGDPQRIFMDEADRLETLGVWRPELAQLALALGSTALPRDVIAAAALIRERWPRGAQARQRHGQHGEGVLTVSGVRHRYTGAERDALDGITLELDAGTMVAIVGANGAGKSTLGLVLAGALRPTAGAVLMHGRPVTEGAAAGRIAYVFQYPERGFLCPTAREELAYSPRAEGHPVSPREVDEMLARFGLGALAAANPHALSHGEKRRLSVASALVTRPEVLVLDEPTFGQDQRHTRTLLAILEEERSAGRLVVVITHDLSLVADHADRVIALDAGRIAFDGPPSELFARSDVLARCALVRPPIAEAFAHARPARPDLPAIIGLAEARAALSAVSARPV